MSDHILAIDAGTTSVRALIIAASGRIIARAGERYELSFPAPDRVEQDAEDLWAKTLYVIRGALAAAKLSAGEIAAIGITAQRASVIIWERAGLRPVAPLVSWQDMRGSARAAELLAAGFLVLPQTSASKLEAVVATIPGGTARLKRGELAWGNVESFLIARLTGGAHVTDGSHACVTGYYDYATGAWIDALIAHQGLSPEFFPRIVDTACIAAETDAGVFGAKVPIAAIIADQQSALIGQGAFAPGAAKITLGTSATLDVATGADIFMTASAFPLVVERSARVSRFCIEGMVVTGGALLDWLAGGLGLAASPAAVCALAGETANAGGVSVLPALQGLGTPHGDPARRGLIAGLSRGTIRAHIARAGLEGIGFRLREITEHLFSQTSLARPPSIRVDGGAAESDLLVQTIADATGIPLERLAERQATALGAAIRAGEVVGALDAEAIARLRRADKVFHPGWSADEREARAASWAKACGLT
jgi:glycerol kinase